MLAAMVAEVCRPSGSPRQGLEPRLLRRAGLRPRWPAISSRVEPGCWSSLWPAAVSAADAVWLVAPETDGQLASLARAVESAGARLLGPSASAIAVAASKTDCHRALAGRVRQPDDLPAAAGWVVKPDDGVAAAGVRRLPVGPRPRASSASLVQPFVEGVPMSLCVLSDGVDARVLSVNRQHIHWDASGVASYRGGVTNVRADRDRFAALAQAVQISIPGLWGCWGIDLVLPYDDDPVLIEVNPRLTTAFVALHAATGVDLLGALLMLAEGRSIEAVALAPAGRAVAFTLDSTLEVEM